MQQLVAEKKMVAPAQFEVIADASASQVLGGAAQDCPKLVECGRFSGDCPNLTRCEQFG
mgnify:CR=1 FL=1